MTEMTKMTDWYNPSQLLDTAKKTVISTIIGENADPRLVSAAPPDGSCFDYSENLIVNNQGDFEGNKTQRQEIWIDYVSDVGDGWNSTYSIAYTLAQETLDVAGETLPRGEILIFGGDGVYPTANDEKYEKKLVEPYRMAFNSSRNGGAGDKTDLKKNPHIFVLPGNHDWYDSLVAFQKIFCTHIFNNRIFAGGWRTRQRRSYFALKLPQNWWLLGVDLQLSHNIDVPQLQYFESLVKTMQEGDKVILCVPEPYWVKTIKYQDQKEAYEKLREKEKSVERLEKILAEKNVEAKLYVAGDLHHYRRFESSGSNPVQKITAGGGGAFLHPTHDFDFGENPPPGGFVLKKNYPEAPVSRKMDWKNFLGFILRSPKFGILTAILYPLLALLIRGELNPNHPFLWREALKATINRFIAEPLALIVVILMLLGLMFFTDSNSKIYRRTAGFIHGLTHLTAIFFLGWLGYRLSQWIIATYGIVGITTSRLIWFGCIVLVCGLGGYVIGSVIMGLYLFVSLHIFGRHDNEAFSALKIEDYKNFLRIHITKDNLTIYPIKIEKVGRKWARDDVKNTFHAEDKLKPELIETINPIN